MLRDNSAALPVSVSPGVKDPTRTLMLRRSFSSQASARFRGLKGAVNTYIIKEDRLRSMLLGTTSNTIEYVSPEESRRRFLIWLEAEMGIRLTNQRWTDIYVFSAYSRGVRFAASSAGLGEIYYIPERESPPQAGALAFPLAEGGASLIPYRSFLFNRMNVLADTVFDSLKGITSAMGSQIQRIIADMLLGGKTPREIAREINRRVDKIGITRARLLARTSVAKIYNHGAVDSFLKIEQILDKKILALYRTAGDEFVRPRHAPRNEKLYTLETVRSLFGEPNCRCSFSPYIVQPGEKIALGRFGPVNPA